MPQLKNGVMTAAISYATHIESAVLPVVPSVVVRYSHLRGLFAAISTLQP